jgi:hypothetical protein
MTLSTYHKPQSVNLPAARKLAPSITIFEAERLASPAPFAGAEFEADAVEVEADVALEEDVLL